MKPIRYQRTVAFRAYENQRRTFHALSEDLFTGLFNAYVYNL